MIYFAQAPDIDLKPIKIGTTGRVGPRIRAISSQIKSPLNLLGVMDGGHREEKALHRQFSHLRCYGVEWFSPADDLHEFISANTRKWNRRDDAKSLVISLDADTLWALRCVCADKMVRPQDFVRSIITPIVKEELRHCASRLKARLDETVKGSRTD